MSTERVSAARLEGRRILVVGGGTQHSNDPDAPPGNGRAIAVRAASHGAQVAVSDRNGDAAQETARLVEKDGGQAAVIVADIADPDACEATVREATGALGGLDGLVLNVGIGLGRGGLEGTTAAQWDTVFAVNVRAQFLLLQQALPAMDDGGSVVLISSVAALRPGSNLPAYDASKAGQLGLARHAAREGSRRGIRVNTICPGLIDTPLGRHTSAGRPSRSTAGVPFGRMAKGWEIAYAALFFISDESVYVNAQALAVDSGITGL